MFTMFLTSPWGNWTLLLAQAVTSIETRAADSVQYVLLVGVIAILGLIYRIDHRLARVEQKLDDPDRGVVAELALTRRFRHNIRNKVFAHGFRLRSLEQHTNLPVIDDEADDLKEFGGKEG